MLRLTLLLALGFGSLGSPLRGAPAAPDPDRTAWFKEAKFGLFIHWGIYSIPAGVYQGRDVFRSPGEPGAGEWILHDSHMPLAEYKRYAREFNPTKFDADRWVEIAKAAGMKYIVITAKHHDGFALFRSAVSDFNVVDATPFGRDVLKELAAACQQAGLRLGFYYSQAQDWSHPGGASWGLPGPMYGGDPARGRWDPAQAGDFDSYIDHVAIPQVKELLTNYGPVSMLWWDTPVGMTPERAARFEEVLKLQPQMLTNNRLLDPIHPNAYSGDTATSEQRIPAGGNRDRLLEVCMTMNDTWGFKAHDQNWKSAADLTRKLIDIVSKGGNFLLNVGPTAEGEFPAASIERLAACGAWVRANQEAIYGTTAGRFSQPAWGRSTTKGRALYLEVFYWPSDGRLVVPGLATAPTQVSLLVGGQRLPAAWDDHELVVSVPRQAPDPVATVIKLEFDQVPVVNQALIAQNPDGSLRFPAAIATIVNAYGGNARAEGNSEAIEIGHWERQGTAATWRFNCTRPGDYIFEVDLAASLSPVFSFGLTENLQHGAPIAAGGADFRSVQLGRVKLPEGGEKTLSLTLTGGNQTDVRVRSVRLIPAPSSGP